MSEWLLLNVKQHPLTHSSDTEGCMVRSADVIHSFALPGCILKVDAIPGRVNEVPITVNILGDG